MSPCRWCYYVATAVQFLVSSMSSSVSHESLAWRWACSVVMLYSSKLFQIKMDSIECLECGFMLWVCTVAKSSSPALPWTSVYIFLSPPFLVLAHGMGRQIRFCLSQDFSFSGFWFSAGSAGQFGTAPNPVMISTHTRGLMAVCGREEADPEWLKLMMEKNL